MIKSGWIWANACFVEKYPLLKGTSDILIICNVLVIDRLQTLCNDADPVVNVVNWGRSNEMNQINQTSQTQGVCFMEWFLSCLKCS